MSKMKDREIREAFIKRNLSFFKKTTFVNEMGVNSKNIVDLAALDFDKNIFTALKSSLKLTHCKGYISNSLHILHSLI